MTHLLHIKSSIFGDAGVSTRLSNRFVDLWKAMDAARVVTVRDLFRSPVPHLDAQGFQAFGAVTDQLSPHQRTVAKLSDSLIAEIRAADIVVLSAPMYNLFIPSGLKAYIDHITRAGETFRYTDSGSIGLLTGKQAVVTSARGGLYAGTESDLITPYLSAYLSSLDFEEVHFIYAEGLAVSDEFRVRGLESAEARLQAVLEQFPPARLRK